MVVNIAHRGARSLAPENTLVAARRALAIGADLWETDVSVTADGELVLMHDDTLARTTDAETRFPGRAPWPVSAFALADIQRLDAGSWFAETDPFGQIAAGVVTATELAAHSGEGVRAGIQVLAPFLIGQDPRELGAINRRMDGELFGTLYAKTALDIACWDILGKAASLPVYALLGGKLQNLFPFTGFVTLEPTAETAALIDDYHQRGCNRFEFKASGDPATDIHMIHFVGDTMRAGDTLKVDANGGWKLDDALRIAESVRDVHVLFEQPCRTYEACRTFRESTSRPVALDESIQNLADLLRALQDRAIDVLNIKTGRVGGLTKARQMRDLCATLGIPVYIQDTAGGEFNAAAIVHLAHSTPPGLMLSLWDCAEMVTTQIGRGLLREPPEWVHQVYATDRPGLGVEPILDALGQPMAIYS